MDVWCCFCCWLIASKCLELCDANVIMANRGNGNPFFFLYVLQVCSKKVLLIGLETHAGGSFLLDEFQYLPVILKQIMLTIWTDNCLYMFPLRGRLPFASSSAMIHRFLASKNHLASKACMPSCRRVLGIRDWFAPCVTGGDSPVGIVLCSFWIPDIFFLVNVKYKELSVHFSKTT